MSPSINRFQRPAVGRFVVILLSIVAPALAGREAPKRVVIQFGENFGFVTGEVVRAEPDKPIVRDFVPGYDVTFRIQEVIAPPSEANGHFVQANDLIRVHLDVGYAAQVETYTPGDVIAGRKFLLTIKFKAEGRYEHAYGADAAVAIRSFAEVDRAFYSQARELAMIPPQDRPTRWARIIADPLATDRLRLDALLGLRALESGLSENQKRILQDELLETWKESSPTLPIVLLRSLDFTLCSMNFSGFAKSQERAKLWVTRVLTATPDNLKDDTKADEGVQIFGELLEHHSDVVAPAILNILNDERCPEGRRMALASVLLGHYFKAEKIESSWENALQSHFARLLKSGKSWPIRNSVASLKFVTSTGQRKRALLIDRRIRDALQSALTAMRAVPVAQDDQQAEAAVREIEELLQLLDEKHQ